VDLVETFRAFATIPADGIAYDSDIIETTAIADYEETLEEVTTAFFIVPYEN
jgi:hypothetical protein